MNSNISQQMEVGREPNGSSMQDRESGIACGNLALRVPTHHAILVQEVMP